MVNTLNDNERKLHDKLQKSLLFYMSLGSKELFHSNTWAWLMENDPAFARMFFPDVREDVALTVTREEQNRDLTIWVNKGMGNEQAYVIENKFKSIPRLGQLVQYENEVGAAFAGGVLTGVKSPTWISDPRISRWRFIPYTEIANGIRRVVDASSVLSDFYKSLVNDYCTMIEDMCEVLERFLEPYTETFLTTDKCSVLSDIRLEDLANKLSAERFADWLRSRPEIADIENRVRARGLRLFIFTDYLKKHSIVDVRIVNDERSEDEIIKDHCGYSQWLLGVQIENDCYSRCVQVGGQTRKANRDHWKHDEMFRRFNSLGWLPSKEELTNPKMKKKDYGKYEVNGKYSFVYQPEGLMTFSYSALKDKIVRDMKAACDFIESNDIQRILQA